MEAQEPGAVGEAATSASDAADAGGISSEDDVMNLILEGVWEEVLITLTQDMDPWNIDLKVLNQRFMEFIKRTAELDLRIPAKIILAAAILYRLKAESLHEAEGGEEPEPVELEDEEWEEVELGDIVIPPLSVPLKREPRGKVSLDDLVRALDKAMTIRNRREARQLFQIDLRGEDIREQIEALFVVICEFLEREGSVTFSMITSKSNREDKLKKFNSLLHLSNQERVNCYQNELFGEIYLYAGPESEPQEGL